MCSPGSEPESEDALLGGAVRLRQPLRGYRVAVDPVLLAAAVTADPGDRVLDVGIGGGAVALCLAARVPDMRIAGLEIDPQAAARARANAALNGRAFDVREGDVAALPAPFGPDMFDRVVSNPPYHEGRGTPSPDPAKARAQAGVMPLADWIGRCLTVLRPRGTLTLVLPAARLDVALARLSRGAGDIAVLPLWPRAGEPARRAIVAARKGAKGPLRLLPGLVLHAGDGGYTPQAEALLRAPGALPMA